jgi:hypothetical protein
MTSITQLLRIWNGSVYDTLGHRGFQATRCQHGFDIGNNLFEQPRASKHIPAT